jgi:hypothetical protein
MASSSGMGWRVGRAAGSELRVRKTALVRRGCPMLAEDAIFFLRLYAEMLEGVLPELEPSCDRDDVEGCEWWRMAGVGLKQADVVGDDAVTTCAQAGCEGRFAHS